MYLIGAEHPNKERSNQIVDRLIDRGERLVTDAEVFQEILHRYSSIGRREFIKPAFDLLGKLVDEVYAVDLSIVDTARTVLGEHPSISARDAIHVASMKLHGVKQIFTFDAGFDQVREIRRINE
jgi:predicted nucleic acid-binding protein